MLLEVDSFKLSVSLCRVCDERVCFCLTAAYGYYVNNDLPAHAVAVANDAISLDDGGVMTS